MKNSLVDIYNDAHWFIEHGDPLYGASILKWLYKFGERLQKLDGADKEGIQKMMNLLKQEIVDM